MVLYIDPILSEGRHMYAKSPFRKQKISKRITEELPENLSMMAFAFPDGNEGKNSSDSEDEAKPAILSIEKLYKDKTSPDTTQSQETPYHKTQSFGSSYLEPTSALLRD